MRNKKANVFIAGFLLASCSLTNVFASAVTTAPAGEDLRKLAATAAGEFSAIKSSNDILKLKLEQATLQEALDKLNNIDRDATIATQQSKIAELEAKVASLEEEIKSQKEIAESESKNKPGPETPKGGHVIDRLSLVKINGLSKTPVARIVVDGTSEKQVKPGEEIITGVKLSSITNQSIFVDVDGELFEMLLQSYPQEKITNLNPSPVQMVSSRPPTSKNKVVELFNTLDEGSLKQNIPKLKVGKDIEFYQEY